MTAASQKTNKDYTIGVSYVRVHARNCYVWSLLTQAFSIESEDMDNLRLFVALGSNGHRHGGVKSFGTDLFPKLQYRYMCVMSKLCHIL